MTDDQDCRIYPAPFSAWLPVQDTSAGGVWVCDKASEEKVLVEPPVEWGRHWNWSVTEDGTAIQFRRKAKPFQPGVQVFDARSGTPGTILCRVGPYEYEVMTDDGVEVWRHGDFQGADG